MGLNNIEVFKVAQNMELAGIEFYTRAAVYTDNEMYKKIFVELADMERVHFNIFKGMETKFADEAFVESDDIIVYLKEHFPTIFETASDEEKMWDEIDSLKNVFEHAKNAEEISVEYYDLLLRESKSEEAKTALKKIIAEEKEHVALMDKYLKNL